MPCSDGSINKTARFAMKNKFIRNITAIAAAAASVSCLGTSYVYADENAMISSNPVISRNCPAYSGASPYTASAANDDFYYSSWTSSSPDYLAYDLSGVSDSEKSKVIAVWYNNSGAYDSTVGTYYSGSNGEPTDYTIEVNSADGGEYPESGWVTVDTVSDNTLKSRQHVVDMTGYNWIRLNVTKADGNEAGSLNLNMDVHSAANGVSDSWVFYGDSITACGMNNCYGTGFATYVNQIDDNYFPIQENGGIGGITSTDGRNNIDRWLSVDPSKYVSIAYGTNDAWGNQTGAEKYYENTAYMVEAVIAAGRTPIVPKIPFSTETGVSAYLSDYNAMIDRIYENYPEVIQGPDFETIFKENTELLSSDGVHPNDSGYDEMRKAWAAEMYEKIYKAGSEPDTGESTSEVSKALYGDADLNGKIEIDDAVTVMCYAADKDSYPLSDEALRNADVYQNGDGVSANDAVSIQKFLSNQIDALPESYN